MYASEPELIARSSDFFPSHTSALCIFWGNRSGGAEVLIESVFLWHYLADWKPWTYKGKSSL